MKKGIRVLAALITLTFVFSLFAGCGSKGEKTAQTTDAKVQSSESTKVEEKTVLPTELVVSSFNWGWPTVDENQDRIGPELEKALGFKVKLNVIKVGSAEEADKKLQMWAALGGADIPDILMTTNSSNARNIINTLGKNGILKDWNEFLDNMPNYNKQISNLIPLCTDTETKKIFLVPQNYDCIYAGKAYSGSPNIRKDWLDKLGLSVPKTTDELYTVLKAFKEKIKTVDGRPVIPMSAFGESFFNDRYMFNVPGLEIVNAGMTEYGCEDWFVDKDGKVQRQDMVYTDSLIKFIKFYNKLYREGLLDPECFTMKQGQWLEKCSSGRVGVFARPGGHFYQINDALMKKDPNSFFIGTNVFDKEINPNLDATDRQTSKMAIYSYWIMKNDISQDKLNAIMKYFDYTVSEEGYLLTNYGIKGKDWEFNGENKVVDTKESADKFGGNIGKKIPEGIWYYNASPNFEVAMKYLAPTANDLRPDNIETLKAKGYEYQTGYKTNKALYVTAGPVEQKLGVGYVDRWKDMVVKGILAKSDDEINKIVANWKETEISLGYNDIAAERTEAIKKIADMDFNK